MSPQSMWRTWLRRKLAETTTNLHTLRYNAQTTQGTCPECGNPYDIEADQPQWQAFKAVKQNPKDNP